MLWWYNFRCKEDTYKIEKYIQIKIFILYCYSYHKICLKENLSDHQIVWEIIFCETSIKLFIMRTILWIIKFSVIVHLCVENSFSWWNSLFLFFNLKHQIDWYIKHTIYFWRVPCGIHIELLSYHKKNKNNNYWKLLLSQLLPNLCQFSGSAIISENSEDTVSWLFY